MLSFVENLWVILSFGGIPRATTCGHPWQPPVKEPTEKQNRKRTFPLGKSTQVTIGGNTTNISWRKILRRSPVEVTMECPLVVAMGCPQEVADTPTATPSDRPNRKQRMNITFPQGKPTPFFIKGTTKNISWMNLLWRKSLVEVASRWPLGAHWKRKLWCPLEVALEGPHLLMLSFVRIFLRWPCGCPLAVTTGVPTGGGQWGAHGRT